ncbi:septum formation initiator [Embleya sp. NBC_00888]|uniref:septum formation initiator n=1 Tax=Embleya sp. NBC_00888 TaxID=2975960 RepID=UPI00386EC7E9|nr:septum formation initiator [Embleya sp. NBC_00888]
MSGAARTMTRIRLAAHQAKGSTRTPFVVLVVGLLGGGLLSLLLLNTALNQGSFELSRLQKRQDQLTDDREALQRELDAKAAPGELARRAQELGLVPGGSPVFIDPATGQVLGVPKPATSKPPLVPEAPATAAATTPVAPPAGGGGPGVPVAAGSDPAGAAAGTGTPAVPPVPAGPGASAGPDGAASAVPVPTAVPPASDAPAASAGPTSPEATP